MASDLAEQILGKQVQAGDRLGTKDELRERYGVASGTLNEAIRLLQTRGLVDLKPGPRGGIFVAAPPAHIRLSHLILALGDEALSVADEFEVRNALEVPIAVNAAKSAGSRDISRLRRLVDRMGKAGEDPAEYLRRNWELHEAIARLSPNELLRTIYVTLLDSARDAVRTVAPDEEFRASWRDNWQLHVDLVEAIASGDPARAVAAAEAHRPMSAMVPGLGS
ncbi:GntR family transcriptional regulator [Intrasporangium chromatireducens Q5-1]|uniref:GntR family transcriptional regulator n=1 Tax=Intrasporangium chromatireducens Q5-1 TaxID=584657 RepID=W9GS62_9MICO|nr:FCD domain-containing protein [Intrasporangium chromatireducens]EWT07653.1 GntR family transcriptional regulator [Intrasporangium chromatireducens Q5-1]